MNGEKKFLLITPDLELSYLGPRPDDMLETLDHVAK